MDVVVSVGIVGSGPSALYLTQALLRSPTPLEITLFEAGERAGAGVPYDPAFADPAMLANIASVEIPALGQSLEAWLSARSDEELTGLGVDRREISDRAFFPRVTLGAYFRARLQAMIKEAPAHGHVVRALTRRKVVDVAELLGKVRLVSVDAAHRLSEREFDRVAIATGHRTPRLGRASAARPDEARLRQPYAPCSRQLTGEIGVLGASLSAIDVVVALAARHGRFERETCGRLIYRPQEGGAPFRVTLMSRRGLLPEADFYCPIPYEPLRLFTPKAVEGLIAQGRVGLLDKAFALFAQELAQADPAYAALIGLECLAPQNFASAYFAARASADPFEWAAANLAECKANAAARRTVAWRYAILRAHEVFATAIPHLTAADRKRFDAGLKSVFVDNYAAVPPASIERLLALRALGLIAIERLDEAYSLRAVESGGEEVRIGARTLRFDHLVDARGQSALGVDDLAFPSLRLKLKANRAARALQTESAAGVEVEASYRLAAGLNPVANVYFLSLPFLLDQNPFVQGLCSAHDIARIAAADLLASLERGASAAESCESEALKTLLEAPEMRASAIYCLDSGLVVLR
jgi:uncharacterized NAD(P)/FAD-binding protein YdhS